MVWFWYGFDVVVVNLVRLRYGCGMVLVWFLYGFGKVLLNLVRLWYGFGIVLVRFYLIC